MLDGLEDTMNSFRTGSENTLAAVRLRPLLALPPPSDDGNRQRDLLQNSRREDGLTFWFIRRLGVDVQL